MADGMADAALAYETIEPSRIRLGESAIIRVTSLDGYLKSVPLPTVPGLTFEILGRSQGLEFVNGKSIPSTYILIRVTPQFVGHIQHSRTHAEIAHSRTRGCQRR